MAARNQQIPPLSVKCSQCAKNRQRSAFSNNQLKAKRPRCRECTGGELTEMTCIQCGATYGLESFTKAQRRNPDAARCVDCVQDHLDVEPEVRDAVIEDIKELGSTANDDATTSTHTNVSDTGSRKGISSEYNISEAGDDDDGWRSRDKYKTGEASSANTMTYASGFVRVKAEGPSLEEKRKREEAREARYQELEATRPRLEDDDEDDEEWEL